MKNKKHVITLVGLLTSLTGFAIDLIQDWANEQQMSDMIEEKVKEALAKYLKK